MPVTTGQDDDVTRLLGEQTSQEVRASVDLQFPPGGVVATLVEAGDAAQVMNSNDCMKPSSSRGVSGGRT